MDLTNTLISTNIQLIAERYKIVNQIAVGAGTKVYKAYDTLLERFLILKEFENSPLAPSRARIKNEATNFSIIANPNVVKIYDVFYDQNNLYLALELIEGADLGHLIRSKRLSIRESISYACDILHGLNALHTAGIIHRDIKPSNIIISNNNQAIIADLGIGKHVEDDAMDITRTGTMIGTPAYMPIEGMLGKPFTFASDIYSAGLVIFEMITGQPAFSAENVVSLIQKATTQDAPLATSLRPDTPNSIALLLRRMLSKEANSRPSITECVKELSSTLKTLEDEENSYTVISSIPAPTPTIAETTIQEVYKTILPGQAEDKKAKITGFFGNEDSRFQAFGESTDFYREHLNKEYLNLLKQAKISFILWVSSFVVSFIVLIVGILLLHFNSTTSGAVTIASQVLIGFIQKMFKDRENYYREQARLKSKHLELGNVWSLTVQSINGLGDENKRRAKLESLIDSLNSRIKTEQTGDIY